MFSSGFFHEEGTHWCWGQEWIKKGWLFSPGLASTRAVLQCCKLCPCLVLPSLLIRQGCWIRPGTKSQEVNWYNSNSGIVSAISHPSTLLFHLLCYLYFVLSTPVKSTKINQCLGKKKTALELTVSVLHVSSKGKKKKNVASKLKCQMENR